MRHDVSTHVLTLVDDYSMCQAMQLMARIKKHVNLALDPELLDRLYAWIAKQDVPPSKTAVFETAIREFLEKREKAIKR